MTKSKFTIIKENKAVENMEDLILNLVVLFIKFLEFLFKYLDKFFKWIFKKLNDKNKK